MDIRALCNTPVITVKATDELYTATNVMREQHVGYLVVVESVPLGGWSRPVGVLTDRDIVVSVLAKGLDPKTMAPFYVEQEAPTPPGGLPQPGKLVVALPDNHLQYALTWYGLAAGLAAVFGFWAATAGRRPGPAHRP